MTRTIAIAGKGGTGKTTIAALLALQLAEKGIVLAIDADPSSNLNLALGLPLTVTVGEVREEMGTRVRRGGFEPGMSKPDYIELRIREALVESEKIDLLAMGRPEGPGCYCAANNMLRTSIDRLANSYDYVVIDNEAGMEHLSRQTTRDVDILLIVSDPSIRGVITAARMRDLIQELRTQVGRVALVVNRVNDSLPAPVEKAIRDFQLDLLSLLPHDPQVEELEINGTPLTELPPESSLQRGVAEIVQRLRL
jgi:CO dehydrogenase maturation factor